jgi:hypothetical protein
VYQSHQDGMARFIEQSRGSCKPTALIVAQRYGYGQLRHGITKVTLRTGYLRLLD